MGSKRAAAASIVSPIAGFAVQRSIEERKARQRAAAEQAAANQSLSEDQVRIEEEKRKGRQLLLSGFRTGAQGVNIQQGLLGRKSLLGG